MPLLRRAASGDLFGRRRYDIVTWYNTNVFAWAVLVLSHQRKDDIYFLAQAFAGGTREGAAEADAGAAEAAAAAGVDPMPGNGTLL